MKDDVIDRLKLKEDEIEERLAMARAKAAAIKDEAVRHARAIKEEHMAKVHEMLSEEQGRESAEIDALLAAMEEKAAKAVRELKDKSDGRKSGAADEVLKAILGGSRRSNSSAR